MTNTFENLDAALTHSRAANRPVFLYWGTKWCPPCAQMQVSVLQRPAFEARRSHLISVSIDGDAPGAQACGDRVSADVYPTLMVLGGDEQEWIRMPCGLTEDTFCEVIDAALRRRAPMRVLADCLISRERALDPDEIRLLAYHYWPLDRSVHPGNSRLNLLKTLAEAARGADEETACRVLTWRLIEHAGRAASGEDRQQLLAQFLDLLRSRHATFPTLYYVLVGLEPVIGFLAGEDEVLRRDLAQAILPVTKSQTDDESLSWTERLIAHSAGVGLGRIADNLRERTRDLVAKADASTECATERQSVMNMAGHLLRQSGFHEEAIRLFRVEIDRSAWPTYFMPYVAELYMELGDRDEAFRWWRRSYEETTGATTRFELGVRYIGALVQHAPGERATIERTVTQLFAEYGDNTDMGRGRVRKSLGLLSRALGSWQT